MTTAKQMCRLKVMAEDKVEEETKLEYLKYLLMLDLDSLDLPRAKLRDNVENNRFRRRVVGGRGTGNDLPPHAIFQESLRYKLLICLSKVSSGFPIDILIILLWPLWKKHINIKNVLATSY